MHFPSDPSSSFSLSKEGAQKVTYYGSVKFAIHYIMRNFNPPSLVASLTMGVADFFQGRFF